MSAASANGEAGRAGPDQWGRGSGRGAGRGRGGSQFFSSASAEQIPPAPTHTTAAGLTVRENKEEDKEERV